MVNRVILDVLLIVCQHDHLANAVASVPHAAETLIDLIQTFRDKSTLFYVATQILIMFAQSNERTKVNALFYLLIMDFIDCVLLCCLII